MQAAPVVLAATLAGAALVLAAAVTGAGGGEAVVRRAAVIVPAAPAPAWRPLPAGPATGLAGIDAVAAAPGAPSAAAVAPELALTDDQQLIPDHALRAVMDAYLRHRADPQRLQALAGHLAARLPAGAAATAMQLAARYDAYLARHDELLLAQHFTDHPDRYRLLSWQQQRQALRERMLGASVTEQWFGTEEAYLQQALEELVQRAGADAAAPPDTEDARRHAQEMRQAIAAAIGRPCAPCGR